MQYYRLSIDADAIDGWYLDRFAEHPQKDDSVLWTYSNPSKFRLFSDIERFVSVVKSGNILDYNLVYPNISIVTQRLVDTLFDYEEVDFLKVKAISLISDQLPPLYVMFVKQAIACVDESHSIFKKFAIDDPVRPDLAGQYKSITKLIIDPSKVNSKAIFRIEGYYSTIIINEKIKKAFEANKISGADYIGL